MARLINNIAIEPEPVLAGLQVIEFVESGPVEVDEFAIPPRRRSGARLDHSFEVFEWLEY
jgi:hypothetical protein